MLASDTQLQRLIDKTLDGDDAARNDLLDHACARLLRLTRKMFHARPGLRRWEMTDDVNQNAMLRLHRALADVRPTSVRHFFNLAAVMVRRTLLDLAKHHLGPHGPGTNHHTDRQPADQAGGALHAQPDAADEPHDLERWAAFHTAVDGLAAADQEIVDLLFYEGLSQDEAAVLLGISLRTVKRRWQSARCALCRLLNDPATDEGL